LIGKERAVGPSFLAARTTEGDMDRNVSTGAPSLSFFRSNQVDHHADFSFADERPVIGTAA
jgi:hypothetical protein